ncbi:glycerate kinase family protein [Paenibacillus cellulositrophicus]|uniref:glycerate kinase family protein n=1 Tax=Paenibacillus cellulositrophicus TaxID=562959 RepID=UPI003F7F4337
MKVLVAMDSFKGSVSSCEAGEAVAAGIRSVYPDAQLDVLLLADGGEGTMDAMLAACGGQRRTVSVTGPLREKLIVSYIVLPDGRTAIIETAAVCGLPLVPEDRRSPMETTTFGIGELVADAIRAGCREVIVGLGGSATNDAGIGMLSALGWSFRSSDGRRLLHGGAGLLEVSSIEPPAPGTLAALRACTFYGACDVRNPLYGPEGAAFVYSPQKGAQPAEVKMLDSGLRRFAKLVETTLGADIASFPGAGAAGGLGGAIAGFLGGRMHSGVGLLLEKSGVERRLKGADIVVTGEGRLDRQTSMGKAPLGLAELAGKWGIPVIALAGSVDREATVLNELGVSAFFSIANGPLSLAEAMEPERALQNMSLTVEQLFRLLRASGILERVKPTSL